MDVFLFTARNKMAYKLNKDLSILWKEAQGTLIMNKIRNKIWNWKKWQWKNLYKVTKPNVWYHCFENRDISTWIPVGDSSWVSACCSCVTQAKREHSLYTMSSLTSRGMKRNEGCNASVINWYNFKFGMSCRLACRETLPQPEAVLGATRYLHTVSNVLFNIITFITNGVV